MNNSKRIVSSIYIITSVICLSGCLNSQSTGPQASEEDTAEDVIEPQIVDIFPLAVGNTWTYRFDSWESRYSSLVITTITGTISLELVDQAAPQTYVAREIASLNVSYEHDILPDSSWTEIDTLTYHLFDNDARVSKQSGGRLFDITVIQRQVDLTNLDELGEVYSGMPAWTFSDSTGIVRWWRQRDAPTEVFRFQPDVGMVGYGISRFIGHSSHFRRSISLESFHKTL